MAIRYLSGINVDSNTLFVDSTNNRVGIGTASPTVKLRVESNGASFSSPDVNNVAAVSIYNSNNSSGNAHAIISLRTQVSGGSPFISFDVENETGWSLGMENSTNQFRLAYNWNSLTTYPAICVTPTTSPNVLIGTTTDAGYKLYVSGTGTSTNLAVVGNIRAGGTGTSGGEIIASGGLGNGNFVSLRHDDTNAYITVTRTVYDGHLILQPYGNVGIGTTSPNRTLTVIGTKRHERVYAYANNTFNLTNDISLNTLWLHLGTQSSFTTDKIYYRVATQTSEEEGEIIVKNTCGTANIEWHRNSYSVMVTAVKARMQGSCQPCEIWIQVRYGSSYGGASTNIQWQVQGGTDSNFVTVNNTGTPGTGTNEANIASTDGYIVANSDNQSIGGSLGVGTTSPGSRIEISGTTGSYNSGIGFVPSGTGARNYRTYIATDGSFRFDDATAGATRTMLTSGGNLLIGTTTDSGYRLRVVGGPLNVFYGTDGSNTYLEGTSGNNTNIGFDGQGCYVETRGSSSARQKLRLQSYNGSDYTQLFIDGANQNIYTGSNVNVGIGTSSPEAKLHVALSNAGGVGGQIVIDNSAGSTLGNAAELSFLTDTGGSGSGARNAKILAVNVNAGNGAAELQFHTWNGAAELKRLNIASNGVITMSAYGSGNVTGTPTYNLAVDASGNIIELPGGVVDGSGTANKIAKWSDSNTLTDANITDNGTTVRINSLPLMADSRLAVGTAGADQTYASVFIGGNLTEGSSQYALLLDPQLDGTTNYGMLSNARIAANVTATTAYGIYQINNELLSGASVVNNFGIYIGNQTSGTSQNWNLYSATGKNYFGGNVLIGTETDAGYNLRVNGTGRYDGNLQLWAGTGGASPRLILGGETSSTDKSIFLESYYMVFQGHNNEGFRFQTTASTGAVSNRMLILGTGTIQLSNYGSGSKTGTVAYNLAVDSSGNIIETPGGVVDGSGTANYVTKWSDANTVTNSQIVDNGTNVGINNASPKTKLDVNGTIGFGSKTMSMTDTFAAALTLNMNDHTGCYVKITAFGDWSNHSTIAYLGEFFVQASAGGYNEPGIIIRQVDNTGGGDDIQAQILDPAGAGTRDFIIELKSTSSAFTPFTAYIQYEVRGQYNSVS